MSTRSDDQLAHHLVQVLARLDGATFRASTTCEACGCLLLRWENCPNCALTNTRPVTDLATRRAV